MSKEILCTLGPSSYDELIIRRLEEQGATLFRINLSHTRLGDLRSRVELIRNCSKVPICFDTEGAQVRTGDFGASKFDLLENSVVRVHSSPVDADAKDFYFYPHDIIRRLQIGDFISIDFNAVLVQVAGFERDGDVAIMRVLSGGAIGRNKAVTIERDIDLPPLTEKDRAALALGVELGIRDFALSFANRGEDIDALRQIVGLDARIISKIECLNGLSNLHEIAAKSNALLIDRGDLSRQVPIEQIPRIQKKIIHGAHAAGVKVYVATNLLESMVTSATPTRAEVNDIYNTLLDGADGLVLAAETAIGNFPVRCAGMVVKLIREFEKPAESPSRLPTEPVSLLVPPHGGKLVDCTGSSAEMRDAEKLPRLTVRDTDLMNCEQIAHGVYSPLTGFMDRQTLEAVLHTHRLPDGTVWTLPILLQVKAADARRFAAGQRVALVDGTGEIHSTLDVTDVFECDNERLAHDWFGTMSRSHPGAAAVIEGGTHCLAGAVTLLHPRPSQYREYELTPSQTRFIFAHKGWSRVVGFHTRNPPHRAHEFIQMKALQRAAADGLYISPVIGPKKRHDFLPGPIMKSYQLMLDCGFYPAGKVVLGSFPTYSRYAGPREAVFTALCRKNMGCSHFIVGRDHTGVGNFYPPEANRRLFERLGDIGIEVLHFDTVGYDPKAGLYRETDGEDLQMMSGTELREALRKGEQVPDWFMRDVIQNMLRSEMAAGRPVLVE